jgi:hypothetical protein
MHTPEIIDQYVENTQQRNEKHGGIFCFEADGNHDTSKETNGTNSNANGTPTISLENEPEEEKDEKDSSGKLKVGSIRGRGIR